MPDDIKISALTNVNTLSDTAVFPMVQDLNGTDTTLKASMSQVAGKVAEGTTFVNLTTTAKDLVGAINEAASTGGSVDITTEITTPAAIQTFNDGGDNIPMKSLVTEIVPIQSGSGTPSPSNPRAITGFEEVTVAVTQNNAWDETWEAGSINPTTGNNAPSTSSLRSTGYIDVTPSAKYVVSVENYTSLGLRVLCYSSSKTFLRAFENLCKTGSISTITLQSDVYYIRFACLGYLDQNTTYKNDIRVSLGDVYTCTLPSTCYGGSLECVEGEGQITYGYVEFDGSSDEDWSYATGNKWATITISDMMSGANQDGITNWLPKATSYGNFGFALGRNNNNFYAYQIPDISGVTDLASWKTYLSNNPLQVVYPLATPTSLSVTGANIPTLSGVNNIYTDCGDIQSLEYFNENGNDIDSLVNLETRLSGRIRTKTYTGDGSVPLVVTFDEVPTMILNFFGNGQNSKVITFPFVYGLNSFGGVYVTPEPWTSPTQSGGGHLLYKVAYSNGGKTMTVRASANDTGAHFNQNGDTYTIYYLV